MTQEMARGLRIALLKARPNCCPVCDALQPLSELMFQQLEQGEPATPTQAMNAAGDRYEVAPLERPTWAETPAPPPASSPPSPAFSH